MFSLLGVDYARQRLENATRRAECGPRSARQRYRSAARQTLRRAACVPAAQPGHALQCVNVVQPAPSCC